MSVLLNINGTDYPYPEPLDLNWGQDATDWAVAVTSGMLQKAGGSFTLLSEVDFGFTYGLKSAYYKSRAASPATTGVLRLGSSDQIVWRDSTGVSDLALSVNVSNELLFNGAPIGAIGSVADTDSISLATLSNVLSATLNLSAASADAGKINASLSIETDGLQAQVPILVGDSGAGGSAGVVPAPSAGDAAANKFLKASGLWSVIPPANTFSDTATIDFTDTAGVITADIKAVSITNAMISASAAIAYSKLNLTGSIVAADITSGTITNTQISNSAAIAYSKLNLTGGIVNADVNASAAIAYSKLNLATSIVNADISASAAIAYSKLNLASSIVNADIANAAAIAYSKLNLTGAILNADVSASAAIARSKLAALTANRAMITDGSGFDSVATTTATEIGYVNGVRSAIQTQIDAQAANNARNLNWITNYGTEVSTSGYATYADAAGVQPVDGTGGSPNVTIARNTSSPLDGVADLEFVKDAANRQGQGFSYDFTIDSAYQGTVQQFAFNYKILSGTYVSGDMTLWIYDVTNGALVSQPSGNSIISTSIPSQQGQCTFQTSINSTSYRAIWHVTTTSALAYTLRFDNISVGPQVSNSGYPATDWTTYTATFTGFGTVNTQALQWRRDGSDLLLRGTFTSGTSTATEARVSIPFTSSSGLPTLSSAGSWVRAAAAITAHGGRIYIEPSVAYITFTAQGVYGNASVTTTSKANGDTILASGEIGYLEARIPIAGWGSNTVMSTSGNTRRVAALITGDPASATSGNPIIVPTVSFDDVAGYNATTGRYTCAVPGVYQMYGALLSASSATTLTIYKNASIATLAGNLDSNGEATFCGSVLCAAGDIIDIRPGGTVDATSMALNINMLQGPQQIAASERISFSANTSTTAATTSAPFLFTVIEDNTYGAYSAATGIFTAPAPGLYQFNAAVVASSGSGNINFYKNGSSKFVGTPISTTTVGVISNAVIMATGDTMQVRPSSNTTATGATTSYFSGFRVGA